MSPVCFINRFFFFFGFNVQRRFRDSFVLKHFHRVRKKCIKKKLLFGSVVAAITQITNDITNDRDTYKNKSNDRQKNTALTSLNQLWYERLCLKQFYKRKKKIFLFVSNLLENTWQVSMDVSSEFQLISILSLSSIHRPNALCSIQNSTSGQHRVGQHSAECATWMFIIYVSRPHWPLVYYLFVLFVYHELRWSFFFFSTILFNIEFVLIELWTLYSTQTHALTPHFCYTTYLKLKLLFRTFVDSSFFAISSVIHSFIGLTFATKQNLFVETIISHKTIHNSTARLTENYLLLYFVVNSISWMSVKLKLRL